MWEWLKNDEFAYVVPKEIPFFPEEWWYPPAENGSDDNEDDYYYEYQEEEWGDPCSPEGAFCPHLGGKGYPGGWVKVDAGRTIFIGSPCSIGEVRKIFPGGQTLAAAQEKPPYCLSKPGLFGARGHGEKVIGAKAHEWGYYFAPSLVHVYATWGGAGWLEIDVRFRLVSSSGRMRVIRWRRTINKDDEPSLFKPVSVWVGDPLAGWFETRGRIEQYWCPRTPVSVVQKLLPPWLRRFSGAVVEALNKAGVH